MNERQLATILAALRLWQSRNLPRSGARDAEIEIIATNGKQFPAMDAEEIDTLCDLMNAGRLPLIAAPEATTLLVWVSRSAQMPAPCGIGSYAIGQEHMNQIRDWVAANVTAKETDRIMRKVAKGGD